MRAIAAVLGALLFASGGLATAGDVCTADAAGNAKCKAAKSTDLYCDPIDTCVECKAATKVADCKGTGEDCAAGKCKCTAGTPPVVDSKCGEATPWCIADKCVPGCQKTLLAKCANKAGEGLLADAAHCNQCIIANINALQTATCTLVQMQAFCALAPDKAAPGPTPVPENDVCSYSSLKMMWTKWEDYCKLPGPKAAATPHGCDKLVHSLDATDPMKSAVGACESQTGKHCYIFDLDGSRCRGGGQEDIFNCRDIPDELSRSSTVEKKNWKAYCDASLPKSYAMTEQCSKGGWDNSGIANQKAALTECEGDAAAQTLCQGQVAGWIPVCTSTNVNYNLDSCNAAKKRKCQCAPYDINGAKCATGGFKKGHGHSAPAAPVHHHHHHHHGHKHHYKAWDADEEVRVEGSGTVSAYSYLPVACVAVAVLAGVAFVVRRRPTSELPAAQAAGYGTVPP